MTRAATTVLQGAVVFIGLAVAGLMLWEPHLEGRNANASLFQIYFQDPFLAFAYIASAPVFAGLYQAFKLAALMGEGRLVSPEALRALRTIRYCALTMIAFVAIGTLIILRQETDDAAGGVLIGLLIATGSILAALTAWALERGLRRRGAAA